MKDARDIGAEHTMRCISMNSVVEVPFAGMVSISSVVTVMLMLGPELAGRQVAATGELAELPLVAPQPIKPPTTPPTMKTRSSTSSAFQEQATRCWRGFSALAAEASIGPPTPSQPAAAVSTTTWLEGVETTEG